MSPFFIFYISIIHLKFTQCLTLTEEVTFEYTPNMNLHFVGEDFHKDNFTAISQGYYASIYSNNGSVIHNDTTAETAYFPSSSPTMLTSGGNLIPVKTLLKSNSTNDTLEMLTKISSSPILQQNLIFPNLLVLWPDQVKTSEEALALMNSEMIRNAITGFNIASELIFVFGNGTELFLFESYNINKVHVVLNGSDGVLDFRCRYCRGPAIRRGNFHGLRLNVTGTEDPEPNDDLHFEMTKGGDLIFSEDGFSIRILKILEESLNFTVTPLKSDDWGKFMNNTWIGSVADVLENRANLGISLTTFRPRRAQAISFLPPVDDSIISAFFWPPDLNAVRDIFARPFQADLWAATFSTWIVLAFFMSLFSGIRKRYGLGSVGEVDLGKDSFIWALATACQQGWDDHPVAGSLRTIFISGSFTGVVAYAGYSAAIVSTLSLRVDPIQNPHQLIKSSLKVGIRRGFITELLMENNTQDVVTELQKKLQKTKPDLQYLNISAGYEYLRKHDYAFISTRDNFLDSVKLKSNGSEVCLLKEVQILKHGFPAGHFVARNSPYKEFLKYTYLTIREPGILWKLRANYTYRKRCLESSDNTGNALGANDVFTAFMILVGGYALSATFLSVEKLLRIGRKFSYIR